MKTLVCMISHLYTDFIVDRYKDLERSLIENHDIVWIHPNDAPENFFEDNGVEHEAKVSGGNRQLDPRNRGLPDNLVLFINVQKQFPEYDYYWFIEYDVMINTCSDKPFEKLFEFYSTSDFEQDADLICDHVHTYATNYNYENDICYPFERLQEKYESINRIGLNKKDIHFGFYTICRLSKRLLVDISKEQDWVDCFFEWGITTYAHLHNLKICSMLNRFTYEPNIYYPFDDFRINTGSNSFDEKQYKEYWEEYPENAIVHPVKKYV